MGQIHFSIPKEIVKRLLERVDVPVLVETGTYKGETAFWAARFFTEVHTIELVEEISKATQNNPARPQNVSFYTGNSADLLPAVVEKINQRALFWLDGHWSPFIHQLEHQCPLLEELSAISVKQDSVIFIDDATAFYGPMPPPHSKDQWPPLEKLFITLKSLFPLHRFTIIDDVVMSAPEDAMEAIESYWFDHFNGRYLPDVKTERAEPQLPLERIGRKRLLKNLLGFKDAGLKNRPLNEKLAYLLFKVSARDK